MIESWKKQLTWKKLSLDHDKPITFVISQWQKKPKPSITYLVYRWAIAVIFLVTLIISVMDLKHPDASSAFRAKWLIYLTDWGYTACTLQALISATMLSTCVIASQMQKPKLENSALKLYKFYWVSNIIATDLAFGITILYWSIIYDENKMDLDAMNFFVHGNNSILMLIDTFMVAHPIRILHCFYPIIFGLCYAVFSVIYYAAGGISREGQLYIYNILDWTKPGITIGVCFAVLAFIIIIHIISWSLHKIRSYLYSKVIKTKNDGFGDEKFESSSAYVNEGLASDVV